MAWPVVFQRWQAVTFLHWSYDPAVVQRLLPAGLTVHTHAGVAWGGLTPFLLQNFRPSGLPAIPWLSSFPETNLRTYVIDSNGVDGLWFLSLDAASLVTVAGARGSLWLPYHWASMTVERSLTLTYRSCRRWLLPAGHHIVAEPRSPLTAEALGERDHFSPDGGGHLPGSPPAWPTSRSSINRGRCGVCISTVLRRTCSSRLAYQHLRLSR